MKRKNRPQLPVLLSLVAVVFLAGCSKSDKTDAVAAATPQPTANAKQPAPGTSPAKTETASKVTDACTLLTKEEIQAVQGEPFATAITSSKISSGLAVSQCYFQLPQAVNSIVVTVTKKAEGPGELDPAKTWEKMFDPEKREKKEEKEEAEKEPEKVEGIGDEAFWTGNRVGGALYVLKGHSFIRISVGGAGDTADKIRKSKALAQNILSRL